jgi:hypothetical protein
MVKKALILIISIITCINININSIYLHTKPNKNDYCMGKDVNNEDNIHISYLITGDSGEEKINVKLMGPNDEIIESKLNENSGEIKYIAKELGRYILCFNVPTPGETYISFEYYTTQEKGHTLDMVKDGI